jgi:hypothetical protein
MRKIFLMGFLILIGIAVLLAGCSLDQNAGKDGGVLQLKIGEDMDAMTITPPVSEQIRHYNIYGTGPDGASFVRTEVTGSSVVVDNLVPGIWTIRAEAVNIQGYVIGEGSATDTIVAGELTTITVTVTPLVGEGELAITMSWPADLVSAPSVVSQMQTLGGDTWFDLNFDVVGNTATYVPTAPFDPIYNGYYKMTIQLKDGNAVVFGDFEAVRILAEWKSTGSFPLTEEDITQATGDVDIIIDPDLQNPIDITFEGNVPVITAGGEMTVTAVPDPTDPGEYQYEWYLNGSLIDGANSDQITVGSGLELGNYRLAVGITYEQTVSSNSLKFSVQEPTDNDILATVEYSASDLTGSTVDVSAFDDGGDLPEDLIQEKSGVMESDFNVLVTLDNFGVGFTNGTYGLRAHIDADNTGTSELTAGDFITVSEVTVSGADASRTLFGPWGGYFQVPVYVNVAPPESTANKTIHVVLVQDGDTWGNYAYGRRSYLIPETGLSGDIFGAETWAPFGQYSFLAVIDMDDTVPFSGAPEPGDYVYSNTGIYWSSGAFPDQNIDSWTLVPTP